MIEEPFDLGFLVSKIVLVSRKSIVEKNSTFQINNLWALGLDFAECFVQKSNEKTHMKILQEDSIVKLGKPSFMNSKDRTFNTHYVYVCVCVSPNIVFIMHL